MKYDLTDLLNNDEKIVFKDLNGERYEIQLFVPFACSLMMPNKKSLTNKEQQECRLKVVGAFLYKHIGAGLEWVKENIAMDVIIYLYTAIVNKMSLGNEMFHLRDMDKKKRSAMLKDMGM